MSKISPDYKSFVAEMEASYKELKKDYGPEFEPRMAETMIVVTNVRYESTKPGGISILEAAMVMIMPVPGENPAKTAYLRKEILAAVFWYQNEQDNISKSVR